MQFPVSEVLPDGAPVIIEDKKENWLKIGKDKWAFYKLIKIVDFITGRVQLAQFLNVRKGPGTNHPIVRKLMKDALVTIVEKEGRWLRIGVEEWVHSYFVEEIE